MAAIGRWFCKCFMGTSGVFPQYVCVALKIHMQKYLSSINAVGNKKPFLSAASTQGCDA